MTFIAIRTWLQRNMNKSILQTACPYLRFLRGAEEAGPRTGRLEPNCQRKQHNAKQTGVSFQKHCQTSKPQILRRKKKIIRSLSRKMPLDLFTYIPFFPLCCSCSENKNSINRSHVFTVQMFKLIKTWAFLRCDQEAAALLGNSFAVKELLINGNNHKGMLK